MNGRLETCLWQRVLSIRTIPPIATIGPARVACLHDFRRSAAKAPRRAGVPESVIMAMGGWKTPRMFRRCAIVSSADQRGAVEMIARERAEKPLSPSFSPPSSETDGFSDSQEMSIVQ